MKKRLVVILVMLSWGLWGCGAAPERDALCQQAADHVAACLGEAPRQVAACSPVEAQHFLGLGCDQVRLAAEGKADDGWSIWDFVPDWLYDPEPEQNDWETMCDGDGYRPCARFDDGECVEWGEIVPCPAGQICRAGACTIPDQTSCVDDDHEDNDTFDTAYTIWPAIGVDNVYPGLRICGRDEDWYRVQVHAGEVLVVRIQFSDPSNDLDLYLYDENGNEEDYSTGFTQDETVSTSAQVTGWYHIKVHSFFGHDDVYNMQFTLQRFGD